jgi:hypothetical protein
MASMPLLHVADTVTVVDFRVVGLALLVFACVLAVVWVPAIREGFHALGRRSARRRAAFVAVAALFLVALLPSVFPYDHIILDAHAEPVGSAEQQAHATHCHVSPGTCADAPLAAGPGQLLMGAPLLTPPTLITLLLIASIPVLYGVTRRPELRPPLALVNSSAC